MDATYLYETILKELLALKNKGSSSVCLKNILVLGSDIRLIVENVKTDSAHCQEMLQSGFSLLSNIAIIKKFLEIFLHMEKSQQSNNLFLKVFEEGFFESIMSANHAAVTLRYALSEMLSFFIFASCRIGIPQSYYKKIKSVLQNCGNDLMFVLYTVYHLCTLSGEYECVYFAEFLHDVLGEDILQKHYVGNDEKLQLLILRIYSKMLSNKCQEAIFKRFDAIICMRKAAKTALVSKSYWSLVHALMPFPKSPVSFVASAKTFLEIMQDFDCHLKKKCELGNKEAFRPNTTMVINLILKSILWICDELNFYRDEVVASLSHLKTFVDSLNFESDEEHQSVVSSDRIIFLFMDEDDELIDFLLLQLELYLVLQKELPENQLDLCLIFNPHQLFIQVCSHLSYDSSIFLDWLVSNETRFLFYLTKYLKHLGTTWTNFTDLCNAENNTNSPEPTDSVINSCVSLLIRLKFSIVKLHKSNLFPYSPGPLVKLLATIENLFESRCAPRLV